MFLLFAENVYSSLHLFLLLRVVALSLLNFSMHSLNALISLVCLSSVCNLLVCVFYQDLNPKVRKEHQRKFLNYLFDSFQSLLLPRHAGLHKDGCTHPLVPRKKENI